MKSEIRNQKSEIRNQKSEIRNQKSEIRNQKYNFNACKYFAIFSLLLAILGLENKLFAQENRETVAIAPFVAAQGVANVDAENITDYIQTAFTKSNKFTVLDRLRTEARLKEISRQVSGLTDKVYAQAGQELGARKILTGRISKDGNQFVITASIIDVETTTIDYSDHYEFEESGRVRASEKLVDILLEQMDLRVNGPRRSSVVWRSVLLPGWGQYYRGDERRGVIFMIAAPILGFLAYKSHSDYNSAKSAYSSTSGINLALSSTLYNTSLSGLLYMNAEALCTDASKKGSTANLFIGGAGLFYAFNLFDAIFLGKSHSAEPSSTAMFIGGDSRNFMFALSVQF